MVTINEVKKSDIRGEGIFLVTLMGLSTDDKPTKLDPTKVEGGNNGEIENGSFFIEIDTQNVYLFDEENTEWLNPDVEEQSDDENQEQVGE